MTASYAEAVERDLSGVARATAARAGSLGIRLIFAIGSYGFGIAGYERRPDGTLHSRSDLDLVAIVDHAVRRAALPDLAHGIEAEVGIPAWVSAVTEAELARREPSQLWWEAAWHNRPLWGDARRLAALAPFRSYRPDAGDGWRLVLNRYVELCARRGEASLKAVRAAIDATLIGRGELPADVGERVERAQALGVEWRDAADIYRRIVDEPVWAADDATFPGVEVAAAALRRAAFELPPRQRLVAPVRVRRIELARHVRLLRGDAWLPGWPIEETVFARIEAALRQGRPVAGRALRAWNLLRH